MPLRRRRYGMRRRRFARRRFRRRRFYRTRRRMVRRGRRKLWRRSYVRFPLSMPTGTQIRRLRYSQVFVLNAASGASDYVTFRANSIVDPFSGVPGHQPMGFDQLALLWAKCRVVKCHMDLRFSAAAAGHDLIGYQVDGLSTLVVPAHTAPQVKQSEALREAPNTVWKDVSMNNTFATNINQTARFTKIFDPRKLIKDKDAVDATWTNVLSPTPANATTEIYIKPFMTATDGTTDPAAVDCQIVLWYTVYLFEPLYTAVSEV